MLRGPRFSSRTYLSLSDLASRISTNLLLSGSVDDKMCFLKWRFGQPFVLQSRLGSRLCIGESLITGFLAAALPVSDENNLWDFVWVFIIGLSEQKSVYTFGITSEQLDAIPGPALFAGLFVLVARPRDNNPTRRINYANKCLQSNRSRS